MFWPTDITSIAPKSTRENSRVSDFFYSNLPRVQSTPGKKISLAVACAGGLPRDFLKKMAKKGLFSRFFGEGGTFLGSN